MTAIKNEIKNLIAYQWQQGELSYKLKSHQEKLYSNLINSSTLKSVVNCSRRFGKSYTLTLIAIEFALQNKNIHIRFAAPTQKQLKEIIMPIFEKIAQDAPDNIRPVYRAMDSCYYFPSTNSYLHIAGCNEGGMENLRGHESHLNIIDEAGSIPELEYLIKDILLPQTLTTGGRTFISSTPPRTPAHYFTTLCNEANNCYSKYTIHDNKSLSQSIIDLYCDESGGENSTTWKREYLCEFVVDENIVIIPEWNSDYIIDTQRDEYYKFYQVYESMDIGGRDKTAILYSYYDFKRAKLVVEHESILSGQQTTTKLIASTIKDIETRFYPDKKIRRFADNNNVLMLQDLSSDYKITFVPTDKTVLKGDDIFDGSMVNELRLFIGSGRLEVNSRCKELIGCLSSGIWDSSRKKFDRSDLFGHFDALAALIYLVRNIDQNTNPIPALHNISNPESWHGLERLQEGKKKSLDKMFRR